ncbi:protein-(glutamine-N5) methyltransferase, release factor-specific [Helicobacter sp. 12S02634-8]|uniref:peptide chain release factor N(5)-glutamine methyltransferase n=1 Tax=Helicobacter sp. 12S02634-8 TaxID=1476199 RepID=UPI000BA4E7C3|nr:peptide chain release factor N(5)-glutamine methyltransferase [Helicobacter sp. 12S02634-8]PAF48109.1 protein-(glutamine-N5) methyltransferase, release factor-specific [Helicobacter sp. 12S02634-8]
MNILEALSYAKRELLHCCFDPHIRPALEAELLLGYVLDTTREWLHTWGEHTIEEADWEMLKACVSRRLQGEPIEYIIKSASFYGREFYVDERVLIPRPETEILVEKVHALIQEKNIQTIGEIGTGSGVISIILGLLCPELRIIATDISPTALQVAQINLENHANSANQLRVRVGFVCANLFEGISEVPKVLVSNPPYIAKGYPLGKNILYEPHNALFGGDVGDEILRLIIDFGSLVGVEFLACEIGWDQKEALEIYLRAHGYEGVFYRDLSGFYRGFIAYLL